MKKFGDDALLPVVAPENPGSDFDLDRAEVALKRSLARLDARGRVAG